MKNSRIFFAIFIMIICWSCKKTVVFYEDKDGYCAFPLNRNISIWACDNFEFSQKLLKDSLKFLDFNNYFIKKDIKEEKVLYDSIYAANVIDMYNDWNKNIVLYNAIIIKNIWTVGVYYPFDLKGTYIFTLQPQEEIMFNSILFLNNKQTKGQSFLNKITNDDNQFNHSFLINIYQNGKEKNLFSFYPKKNSKYV